MASSGGDGHRHARSQTMPIIRGKNALTNPRLLQMMETGNADTHFDRKHTAGYYDGVESFTFDLGSVSQMGIFRRATRWVPQTSRQTCPLKWPSLSWMYWSSLFIITRSLTVHILTLHIFLLYFYAHIILHTSVMWILYILIFFCSWCKSKYIC